MSLAFTGFAAVFDVPDRGGDVIRRGAFGRVLRPVPLLWQHQGARIGAIDAIAETAHGLRVSGRINRPDLIAAVQAGAISGLSIGYRARRTRRGTYRELITLDLIEVSLVAQPMQRLARIDSTGPDRAIFPETAMETQR